MQMNLSFIYFYLIIITIANRFDLYIDLHKAHSSLENFEYDPFRHHTFI